MLTDLAVLGFLALCAYRGYRTGTIAQVIQWLGLVAARAGAKPLALVLTLALLPNLGFPPVALRVGVSVLCFYTLYILASIFIGAVLKKLLGHKRHGRADRAGGLALGLGKGAALAFILLSAVLFFEGPLAGLLGARPEVLRGSYFARLVRPRNAFGRAPLPGLARLEKLMDAARSPEKAQTLASDPALAEVLADPAFKASLTDDSLAASLKAGDWPALKKDPRVSALLKDPRIAGPWSDPLEDQ